MLPKNGIQKWYPNNIFWSVFVFCKSSHGLVLLCAVFFFCGSGVFLRGERIPAKKKVVLGVPERIW